MPYRLNDGPATPRLIKDRARRIVEARYPAWKQRNLIMAGGTELTKMREWIWLVRQHSDRLEESLAAGTLPADWRAAGWPC